MKKCKYCLQIKENSCFYSAPTHKDKLGSSCKECLSQKDKNKRLNRKNQGKCCYCGQDNTNGYSRCDKCRLGQQRYQQSEKGKITQRKSDRKRSQRSDVKNDRNQKYKIKRKINISFKLKHDLRSRLRCAIKNKQKIGSAIRDLGCSIEELIIYLEQKFQPGMTWENWGKGEDRWNIDHIIPVSSFDLTNREQFLQCCHYTNLQPLWEKNNLTKGNKNIYL